MDTETRTGTSTSTKVVVGLGIISAGLIAAAGIAMQNRNAIKVVQSTTTPQITVSSASKTADIEYIDFQSVPEATTGLVREAIEFESVTLADLKRDKGLVVTKDNKVTITLEDGSAQKVDADQWLEEALEFEEFLNQFGYSALNDPRLEDGTDIDASIPVVAQVDSEDTVDVQATEQVELSTDILATYASAITATRETFPLTPTETTLALLESGDFTRAVPSAVDSDDDEETDPGSHAYKSNSFDTGTEKTSFFKAGDKDWFYVDGYVKFRSEGTGGTQVSSTTGMYIDVYVFNNKRKILEATNEGTSEDVNLGRDYDSRFYLCIIEESSGCKYGPSEEIKSGTRSRDVVLLYGHEPNIPSKEKMYYKTIYVGVPVRIGLGAEADMDFYFRQGVGDDYERSGLVPSVEIDGVASAEVDAVAVRAGVEADITLAEVGMDLDNTVEVIGTTQADMKYTATHSATWDASFLDGSVYLVLTFNNPFGKDPKYYFEIVDWPAKTYSGDLFSERNYEEAVY